MWVTCPVAYLQLAYQTAILTEHVTQWKGQQQLILYKLLQGPGQLHWNTLIPILQRNAFTEHFSLGSLKAIQEGHVPAISLCKLQHIT